jgi:hypothetical protein
VFRIPPPPGSVRHTGSRSTARTPHRMGQAQTRRSQPTPIQNPKHYYRTHAPNNHAIKQIKQGQQNSCATTKTPACLPARIPFFFYLVLAYTYSTPDPSSSRCILGRRLVAPRLIKLPPVLNNLAVKTNIKCLGICNLANKDLDCNLATF